MVQIVTQKDIENRLATGYLPASAKIFESAALAASLRIESELETLLDKGSSTDVFYLDETLFGVVPNGMFRLKLKNSFLRAAPEPVILVGSTLDSITEPVTSYKVDAPRGFVSVPVEHKRRYVSVAYDYGFQAGDTIPVKLKEAVLSYIPVVADFSAVGGDKSQVKDDTAAAATHAMAVLIPYRRRLPFSWSPVY